MARTVHLVAPASLDDPARPSGGNVYDRRLRDELPVCGWTVQAHAVDLADLDATLRAVPPHEVALVDGLLASAAPEVVVRHARTHRVVVLVHQPFGVVDAAHRAEEAGLFRSVAAVVTTSVWTRDWLLAEYAVPTELVVVAVPGADRADVAAGTADGGSLLCVGAVTPGKGHDVLLDALAQVDAGCRCTVVGSLVVDPAFAADVAVRADGRVDLVGPFDAQALDAAYHSADVLVLPSRAETYGMVVTEALAHGLPVIGSAVGGVPEAVGLATTGEVPGILVPPADAAALAGALRAWLSDPALRTRLRAAARDRRTALPRWSETAASVAEALHD